MGACPLAGCILASKLTPLNMLIVFMYHITHAACQHNSDTHLPQLDMAAACKSISARVPAPYCSPHLPAPGCTVHLPMHSQRVVCLDPSTGLSLCPLLSVQLCPGCSLLQLLRSSSSHCLPEGTALSITHQLVHVLQHLHTQGVIYVGRCRYKGAGRMHPTCFLHGSCLAVQVCNHLLGPPTQQYTYAHWG